MSISLRHANEKDILAINAIYNEGGVGTTASYDLEPLTVENQTRWWEGVTGRSWWQ
ncbi:GNAT family N-acetyltransferase [Rothia amarae]|uniref:GNAT family N-acetyltransferase n=1 Tax=Rothia amarae TaxID=169480 RepID=UPI0033D65474